MQCESEQAVGVSGTPAALGLDVRTPGGRSRCSPAPSGGYPARVGSMRFPCVAGTRVMERGRLLQLATVWTYE
jgi:hypothetical protein